VGSLSEENEGGGGLSVDFKFELGDRYNFHRNGYRAPFPFLSFFDDDFAHLAWVGIAKPYSRSGGHYRINMSKINMIGQKQIMRPEFVKALDNMLPSTSF
jgi:hypothetical protein